MTGKQFSKALGCIRENYIDEAITYTANKKSSTWLKWSGTVASLAVLLLATAVVLPSITEGDEEPAVTAPLPPSPDEAGGIDGKINVSEQIVILEEKDLLTDTEAASYLNGVKKAIENELVACGVNFDELQISEKGYSHVRTGDHGNTMAVNWRDYLAYDGEKIIATVAVVKENGHIRHFVFWGGDYSYYEKKLKEYRGEELVYLYIGDVDAFITPDNQIFALGNANVSTAIDEGVSYYDFFKTPYNVYVP